MAASVIVSLVAGILAIVVFLIGLCSDGPPPTPTPTPPLILTPSPTPVPPQLSDPSLVARNGFLHLVWQEESGQGGAIYYARARATDENPVFSEPVKVDDARVASSPNLALDAAGGVHVTFAVADNGDWDVYYSQSDDGVSFGPEIEVTSGGPGGGQPDPAIAVSDAGKVHIAWQDGRNGGAVYYARLEKGQSFGPKLMVNDPQAIGEKADVDIALSPDGSIVYAIWADKRTGDWQVYSSRSVNKSAFSGDILVSSAAFPAQHPSIVVGTDGAVHAAWQEKIAFGGRGPVYHTYYGRADPGGTLFPTPYLVSDGASASVEPANPAVAVGQNEIAHVVFETFSYGDGGFIGHDSFSGGAFGSDVSVTDGVKPTSKRRNPSVAIDEEDVIHVVWLDQRNGPWEIFYARSIDAGASFSPNVRVAAIQETDEAMTTAGDWEVEVYSTRTDSLLFGPQAGVNQTYYMPADDSVFLQVTFGLRSVSGEGGTLRVQDVTVTDSRQRLFPVGLSLPGGSWLVGTFTGTVAMAPAQPGQVKLAFEVVSSREYSSEGQRLTGTTEIPAGTEGLPILSFAYVIPSDAGDLWLEVPGGTPAAFPESDAQ
ncbi:MAG: hypothetical protein MUP14_04485 [Dehalococcoidia bacterium]|nr:hypothetical protein [Dehalococcoidia bacterium]